MDKSTFYNTAKNFAAKLKEAKPELLSDGDASLCLIIADSQEIFSGVTGVKIDEGTVETLLAEESAVNALIAAGGARAKQMIIITLDDNGFMEPDESSLAKLMRASVENGACEIMISPEEAVSAASLVTSVAAPDFLSGYDDDTPAPPAKEAAQSAPVGAPAEFASGFEVDENNPFYSGPQNTGGAQSGQSGDVNSLYEQPADAQEVGASGFPNSYMAPNQGMYQQQGGYPQQGMYPQQGGYPQQGMYPQQGGYPQQGMYPQQGGYPQQGMYPQQGGYPQQGMYPQQGGYPQQGMYPQQGGYPQSNPYMNSSHASMYQQQNVNSQSIGSYGSPSVHVGGGVPSRSAYQQGQSQSIVSAAQSGAAYKKRLSNFLGEDEKENEAEETMSKEDMLKLAKDRKKAAKANQNLKKKM